MHIFLESLFWTSIFEILSKTLLSPLWCEFLVCGECGNGIFHHVHKLNLVLVYEVGWWGGGGAFMESPLLP